MHPDPSVGNTTAPDPSATEHDPVCGMVVRPDSPHAAEHDGATFHFCSAHCRQRFVAEPAQFLQAHHVPGHHHDEAPHQDATGRSAEPSEAAEWTCPMHPEIRSPVPGPCPICGMALEPVLVTADTGPHHELVDMTRRFWLAAGLAVVVVLLAMVAPMVGLVPQRLSHQASNWIQLVLATPVVWWAGWPFLQRFALSVRTLRLNMFTLIGLGVGVAWLFSVVGTIAPGLFPPTLRADGAVEAYFEPAAVITALALLGQVLELRARDRTSGAIKSLLTLTPPTARRLGPDDVETEVSLEHVEVGDRLRVRPGDRVPVDGSITEGSTTLDESMITGEPMPVTRSLGDTVIGGTINQHGSLIITADRVGHDTMLARIVAQVAEAQRSRAPIQRLADRVSAIFVPAVIVAAVVAFGVWLLVGPDPRLSHALVAAVAVLIIACPCALGLATPMSIMVGVGRGARAGLLVKDAESLERLASVDTVVLDKTGTLTEGRPTVTAVEPDGLDADELVALAAAAERGSEHPLAAAVLAYAEANGIAVPAVTDFTALPGRGVTASVGGRNVVVGTSRLLSEHGIAVSAPSEIDALTARGATVVHVGTDTRAAGRIVVSDRVRDTTPAALDALRREGVRLVMLSGDAPATAQAVADELGIGEVVAGVLPEGKSAEIQRLSDAGRVVAMVGDGVNDAPALATADVGIALGSGTDVAIDSAGLTLLRPDLGGVAEARALSRATMRNIRQNLGFAFAYNIVGIPIAAGVLYPALGIMLSPAVAAAAMALSSVSVIGNALRLRGQRLR